MEKVTFLQSIIKVLNLIASIPFFIEILILTAFLLIIMIFFYFRKSKKGKITSLIIYFVTLLLLPISHFSFFVETLDKIVENFVSVIYFPSCYVYIATLLITDFSILKNVIKNTKDIKRGKWYQALNIIYFFVFQFLFFLIIRVVITNDIDIFTRSTLYSNANLTSLIQISSYLFWIRIGIMLISFIIDRLSKFSFSKKDKKDLVTEAMVSADTNTNNILVNNNPVDDYILDQNTTDNGINKNITNDLNDNIVKPEIINSDIPISNLEVSSKKQKTNKAVKPLENGLIDSNMNLNNSIDIDNSLYNMKPITPIIKPLNSSLSKPTNGINPVTNNEPLKQVLKPSIETLDLSSDNDSSPIKSIETLDINQDNNPVIEVLDINDNDNDNIHDLNVPDVVNLSTKSVDKNNIQRKPVKSSSLFDILKETEKYVPINQESNVGNNANIDIANNNFDLTINDVDDSNDNYFDDFYD